MDKARWLKDIEEQIRVIAEEAKGIIMAVLSSDKGINKKVGVNTLVDSNLFNELSYNIDDIEVITLLVNDYIQYIESGRKSGTYPPPHVIAEWCQRKGLPSDNGTVYLICRSIYENGIPARPIFEGADGVWEIVDRYWDDWADMVFNTLTEELDNYFNE
jgi:hypothetical protein